MQEVYTCSCYFDFTYVEDYDEDVITKVVAKVLGYAGCELIDIDFHSVDYSDYPEYRNKSVSQCGFDMEYYDGSYDSETIEADLEFLLYMKGYEVIGIDWFGHEIYDEF